MPNIQQENVESYELIVDTNKPIISTGDMKSWDTSKPFDAYQKTHINMCVYDSRWENPRVGSSILSQATIIINSLGLL
jgi:hypothetical protein